MRRREFLAATALTTAGSVAGCLGSLGDADTATGCHEPVPGRSQWRYDACNSGHAAGINGPTEEPTLQRMYHGGAPPLTANGTLFTETWSADIGGDGRWELGDSGSAARGAALYEDSVLSYGSPFEGFWAISTADGSKRWEIELSSGPIGPLYPVEPLTIRTDRAYYGTMTGVGCVDLAAKEEAWVADLDAEFPYLLTGLDWQPPAVTSSHVFALNNIGGKRGPGGQRDWKAHPRRLFALDPDTGDLDWTIELAPEERGVQAAPIVADGLVFVVVVVFDHPEPAYDNSVRVIAVDPDARKVAWRQTFPVSSPSMSATADGRFYVSHGQGTEDPPELVALDTADGAVDWRVEHHNPLFVPTITDEAIVACDGNHLRAFDPETGDTRWDVDLVGRVIDETDLEGGFGWRSPFIPVVHDGRVFVYLGEDRIVRLQ